VKGTKRRRSKRKKLVGTGINKKETEIEGEEIGRIRTEEEGE
jgi:hypothetical protein